MTIVEYFRYFESKYSVKITTFQKRMFLRMIKNPYYYDVNSEKIEGTILHTLIEDYKELKRRSENDNS